MIRKLYNRFFVCPKWGHRPPGHQPGFVPFGDNCVMCGGSLYPR